MKTSLFLISLLITLFEPPALSLANAEEADDESSSSSNPPDYIIVGAGGGGLQLALFCEKYGLSYTILEKESTAGSFWTQFPVFKELISVNKWVRNETQRFRYDWHSFLETPHRMLDISDDYFPKGEDWHTYMTLVAQELKIEYKTPVVAIASDDHPCVLLGDGAVRCAKKRVFVGTGLVEKKEPYLHAMGAIPYSQITKQMARHKRVCIFGNGNAGFETAQNIYNVADRVVVYGKHAHRLSSVTKYTGDVRVKFLQVLENLHGKLLDTVEKFDYTLKIDGLEGYLSKSQIDTVNMMIMNASILKQFRCEIIVTATGFESHVPGRKIPDGERFPATTSQWYAATDNSKVHYIGWLMHDQDFRRGAGGFLSGFRYLIRNLVHHVRQQDQQVEYPHIVLQTKQDVVNHIQARCQVADDLIILQDGVVVRDAIVKNDNGGYSYYEGISYQFHPDIVAREDVIYMYFAWGDGRNLASVFDNVLRFSDSNKLINLFIHPVLEIKGMTRDLMEDLDMEWNTYGYTNSIQKTVMEALNGDMAHFKPKVVFPYTRAQVNDTGTNFEEASERDGIPEYFIHALWKAVATNGTSLEHLANLRTATRKWMPQILQEGEPNEVSQPSEPFLATF